MSVKVTLEFESAAAAALALNLLDGYARGDMAKTKPEVEKPKAEKPKAEKPKAEKPKAETPEQEAPAEETAKAEPTEAPAATVEYPVLQKAVFALAGKSRDAAAAVAASFGVKTFKDLDAGKWGEALVAVKAKIAELGE